MTIVHSARTSASGCQANIARPGAGLRRLSFRGRLIAMVLAFGIIMDAMLAGGILLNARTAVEEEVASSFAVASRYLQSRKVEIEQATFPENYLADLGLEHGAARHVRAIAVDSAGRVVPPRTVSDETEKDPLPPEWFIDLLSLEPLREEIPLVFRTGQTATILLESEPFDEIAEVWQDFRFVVPLAFAFTVVLSGASILLLNTVFNRIRRVSDGLGHLHGGKLDARLDDLRIPELDNIVERFNDLAERLSLREAENRELNRRLLTLQDDERRQIAQDLHDELGPYLFALRTATLPRHPVPGEPSRQDLDLPEIAHAIQVRTRRIITSLRPMSLGEVPLADLIEDLVETFGRLAAESRITLKAESGPHSYGEAVDLTIHRFVQESIVNALRHGRARNMDIHIRERSDGLFVSITDDGTGPVAISTGRPGYGFVGISDRVRALGGTWEKPQHADGRTVTCLLVPVEQRMTLCCEDSPQP